MRHVDTLTVLKHANSMTEVASQIKLDTRTPNGRAVAELVKTIEHFAASMQFTLELPEPAALAAAFRRPRQSSNKNRKRRAKCKQIA